MDKSTAYLDNVLKIITDIKETQTDKLHTCARLFADTLKNGRNIFLLGTGHSSLLAQEVFYRAGGLVNIRPILETSLLLHESAVKSTKIERLEGYAHILFERYEVKAGDVMVIISNSGRNGVPVDMAQLCAEHGVKVVALTNMRHTLSGASRHKSGKRLFELADVVLDNGGCIGDAAVDFPALGRKAAPTSTAAGAAILNAVVAQTIQNLLDDGIVPEVWSSSNIDGGDELNNAFIKKYKGEILSL